MDGVREVVLHLEIEQVIAMMEEECQLVEEMVVAMVVEQLTEMVVVVVVEQLTEMVEEY